MTQDNSMTEQVEALKAAIHDECTQHAEATVDCGDRSKGYIQAWLDAARILPERLASLQQTAPAKQEDREGLVDELRDPWLNNPTDSERGVIPEWCHSLLHRAAKALSPSEAQTPPKGDEGLAGEVQKGSRWRHADWYGGIVFEVPEPLFDRILTALNRDSKAVEGEPDWRKLAINLAVREADYRLNHDVHGDGSLEAGRSWDRMRRAGQAVRDALGIDAHLKESSNG